MATDSPLRDYLEVYSLSSDKVFFSTQLKTCLEFSGWTCQIVLPERVYVETFDSNSEDFEN